jgi:hypothetical protein
LGAKLFFTMVRNGGFIIFHRSFFAFLLFCFIATTTRFTMNPRKPLHTNAPRRGPSEEELEYRVLPKLREKVKQLNKDMDPIGMAFIASVEEVLFEEDNDEEQISKISKIEIHHIDMMRAYEKKYYVEFGEVRSMEEMSMEIQALKYKLEKLAGEESKKKKAKASE